MNASESVIKAPRSVTRVPDPRLDGRETPSETRKTTMIMKMTTRQTLLFFGGLILLSNLMGLLIYGLLKWAR